MMMVGRKYSSGNGYRYGFNGKENDNEVKGEGNQQDYGMRIYDARLGRFLSVDPLELEYPWYTPYQFAGNMPIAFIDIDGMEPGEPDKRTYQVEKGNTLSGIAEKFSLSVDEIVQHNPKLKDRRDLIFVGETITIPIYTGQIIVEDKGATIVLGPTRTEAKLNDKEFAAAMDEAETYTNVNLEKNKKKYGSSGKILSGFAKGMVSEKKSPSSAVKMRNSLTIFQNKVLNFVRDGYIVGIGIVLGVANAPAIGTFLTEKSIEYYVIMNAAANQAKRKIIYTIMDIAAMKYGRHIIYKKEFWKALAKAEKEEHILSSKNAEKIIKTIEKIIKEIKNK